MYSRSESESDILICWHFVHLRVQYTSLWFVCYNSSPPLIAGLFWLKAAFLSTFLATKRSHYSWCDIHSLNFASSNLNSRHFSIIVYDVIIDCSRLLKPRRPFLTFFSYSCHYYTLSLTNFFSTLLSFLFAISLINSFRLEIMKGMVKTYGLLSLIISSNLPFAFLSYFLDVSCTFLDTFVKF